MTDYPPSYYAASANPAPERPPLKGEAEADIDNGLLNIKSPLARALIGKEVGDSVEVRTPGGTKDYEILDIMYS